MKKISETTSDISDEIEVIKVFVQALSNNIIPDRVSSSFDRIESYIAHINFIGENVKIEDL